MARPQIHGYDLTAVKFLKTSDREVESLISGGDEKILRLFTPTPLTANFLNTLASLDLKIRNA
jgi:elongator complex protein 2